MASNAPAEASGTHKDPITGEMISKSELKRRTKEREKAAKKAERESNAPSPAVAAGGPAAAVVNEDQLDPTVRYFIVVMHRFGVADPYDHYSNITKTDPVRFKSCVKR